MILFDLAKTTLSGGDGMPGHQFVVNNSGLPWREVIMTFPEERFDDLDFRAGKVNDRGTYVVDMRSQSPDILSRAATMFREMATKAKALIAESAID